MSQQKQQKLKYCLDGRCPEGVDTVREIGLSHLEKRAIFFSLQGAINRAKKDELEAQKSDKEKAKEDL